MEQFTKVQGMFYNNEGVQLLMLMLLPKGSCFVSVDIYSKLKEAINSWCHSLLG